MKLKLCLHERNSSVEETTLPPPVEHQSNEEINPNSVDWDAADPSCTKPRWSKTHIYSYGCLLSCYRVTVQQMPIVAIRTHAAQGSHDTLTGTPYHCLHYRFGFCGEDAGYCYPLEGCILRGVEIEGGDLTASEGGGGVDVERGQLDGCAYICEENSLCGWYTYDKSANKCFLKGSRGFLSNKTDTANIVSGATAADGCNFNPRVEGTADAPGRPAARRPNRRRRRRRCRFPFVRRGRRCIHYCQVLYKNKSN